MSEVNAAFGKGHLAPRNVILKNGIGFAFGCCILKALLYKRILDREVCIARRGVQSAALCNLSSSLTPTDLLWTLTQLRSGPRLSE